MTLAQVISILIAIEPVLSTLDASVLQPLIKKWISEVPNAEVQSALMAVDAELDKLLQVEIAKI